MTYPEGFHIVRDEDWSPNLFDIPESGTVYKFGIKGRELACDGGIGEVDDRLSNAPLISTALGALTEQQLALVKKAYGFEPGFEGDTVAIAVAQKMKHVDVLVDLREAFRSMRYSLTSDTELSQMPNRQAVMDGQI
jgi:hypothetical protein